MEASLWVMNADARKTASSPGLWRGGRGGTRIAYTPKAIEGPQAFARWMTENAATQITQVQHPP
jgi:hypothetical protein